MARKRRKRRRKANGFLVTENVPRFLRNSYLEMTKEKLAYYERRAKILRRIVDRLEPKFKVGRPRKVTEIIEGEEA